MARPRWQERWDGLLLKVKEAEEASGRKEKTQKMIQMGSVVVAKIHQREGKPRGWACQNKEAGDLKASPWKWSNLNNREKNRVFRKEQSVENLLDKNQKLSHVGFIEVPEETMELKICFLKKLTEENAISLEKGHTFMFFECCKPRPWKITADVSVSTTASLVSTEKVTGPHLSF